MKDNDILVIDLFSGPGGLGEGFASYIDNNKHPFKIGMSVEKDPHAHMTLTTGAFYRLAKQTGCLDGYYQYLNGNLTRDELASTRGVVAVGKLVEPRWPPSGSSFTQYF